VKQVRAALGTRLRELRRRRGWSQGALGERAGLSGKFIGEVERGEKSISVDSLYRVSVALDVPLRDLVAVHPDSSEPSPPAGDATEVLALLARCQTPDDLRRAYDGLRSYFGNA
jgi:transcriptional regulator with XRE-family HTH domain